MSRIGKQPITVSDKVKVTMDGNCVKVEGPAGKLEHTFHTAVEFEQGDGKITVKRKGNDRIARGQHGLSRTLLHNMVTGVVTPFKKSLEVFGVGYRAEMVGTSVKMQVGLSHDVLHPLPDGVQCKIDKQTVIHLEACDKALLGQVAAALRAYRPCEPYKGKGVKYMGERIRRKEGKTGAG